MKKIILLLCTSLILSSCTLFRPHRIDIEQGNLYTTTETNQIHLGMTQNQVQTILGTSVLVNIFSPERMDYIYAYQHAYGSFVQKRISYIFKHDHLVSIENSDA